MEQEAIVIDRQRLCSGVNIRGERLDPVEFGTRYVKLPKSAVSRDFSVDRMPWQREPLEKCGDRETRRIVNIKPIQSGGSTIGEVAMNHWSYFGRGLVYFYWEHNEKAGKRWDERLDEILRECEPVEILREIARVRNRFKVNKCSIDFGATFLRVLGAREDSNLDSSTVRYLICEEVHNWAPGHLVKAFGRTTMVWDYKALIISNASRKGDQLDQCFSETTMQLWENRCPGCRKYHHMRTRWDARRPELGGLRYNAEGSRLENGRYNYNKLAPTIRFQMPCGHEIPDDPSRRLKLSESGRYSSPTNVGAHLSFRGYRYEAVTVHQISWLTLVQEKHAALRARKFGDPEPWRRYVSERECQFYDPDDVPIMGKIELSTRRKDHGRLPGKHITFAALDRQQGNLRDGEIPHWWAAARDIDQLGNSLLVHEGKHNDDEDAAQSVLRLGITPHHVVCDSGDDTYAVYLFCMKYGFHAIKGDQASYFTHHDGARRIFSPERPLHLMLGNHPSKFDYIMRPDGTYGPDPREPMFWLYSKHGIAERLHWLRAAGVVKHEVPGDVSEDYLAHQESEELRDYIVPKTGERTKIFVQIKPRNDLLICERYIAMLMDMAGLIGANMPQESTK